MTKKTKKIVGISLGVAGGVVGAISLGTIIGVSVDSANYKKSRKDIESQIKNFDKNNESLRQKHDSLYNIVKDEPMDDDVKAELNSILRVYDDQIRANESLRNKLQVILDKHSKYHVGHHFGNKAYLRAKINREAKNLFDVEVPNALEETKKILSLSQVDLLQKKFDSVQKLANELYEMKDDTNVIIGSISDKDSKFNNLQKALKAYKHEKEEPSFKDSKELTPNYILAGLKLISEDNKLWNKNVLVKFIEKFTANSISKRIINDDKVQKLSTISGLATDNYVAARNTLSKYFTKDGEVRNLDNFERSAIVSELVASNEKLGTFNNEVKTFVTNLVDTLKAKFDEKNILVQTNLVDLSGQKVKYDELYKLNEELKTFVAKAGLWNLEKAPEILAKSVDLIEKEKVQNNEFATFVINALKSKVKDFKGDLTSLVTTLKLQNEWDAIKAFANSTDVDFSLLTGQDYLSQRDTLIDSFVSTKANIIKLKEESLKHYLYGKERIRAFKEAYTLKKDTLNDFKLLNFSYSSISDQEAVVDNALSKDVASQINANNKDLGEFLNNLLSINELTTIDANNIEIIKTTVNSNINDTDKLPSGLEITDANIQDFKPLAELNEAKAIKSDIDSKNTSIQSAAPEVWEEGNINTVKTAITSLFNTIDSINSKATELSNLKAEYKLFLDNVATNINELTSVANTHTSSYAKNNEAKSTIIDKAKADYLNVNSKNDFSAKINNSAKIAKEDFMKGWIEVFKAYDSYANNKQAVNVEYDKYSNLDIQYVREAAGDFINQQQGLIDGVVDSLYKELEATTLDWAKVPEKAKYDSFANGQKDLLVSFVKNFYNIVVNQFGYNKTYNIEAPKYTWSESDGKFNFTTSNVLSGAEPKFANKTKAMEDAKKFEKGIMSWGLKPRSDKAKALYSRYGFHSSIYGVQIEKKSFNELLKQDTHEIEYDYKYRDKYGVVQKDSEGNIIWKSDKIIKKDWEFANTNNYEASEVGSDFNSALAKMSADNAPYILDVFFKLLNYENRLSHKVVKLLKDENKIITKAKYDQIMQKFVTSMSKLTFANTYLLMTSMQGEDTSAGKTKKMGFKNPDGTIIDDGFHSGIWKVAGRSRNIRATVDETWHKRIEMEGWLSDELKSCQVRADDRYPGVNNGNLFREDISLPVSWKSGHVISMSGPLQNFIVTNNGYLKGEEQKNWAAYYCKLGFKDEFGDKFEESYFDWYIFWTTSQYKCMYGANYFNGGFERQGWTDFFNQDRFNSFQKYTPVTE